MSALDVTIYVSDGIYNHPKYGRLSSDICQKRGEKRLAMEAEIFFCLCFF